MPVVADPDRAEAQLLLDVDATVLARFEPRRREHGGFADRFTVVGPHDRTLAAVLDELHGWRVSGDVAFGERLVAAGGRPRRHVHVLSRDLVRDPAPVAWADGPAPAGYRLTPVDRPASDLAPACRAAYPPGHPDHADIPTPDRPEVELEQIMSGRLMGGPLLGCSGLAVADADDAVAGAVLINHTPAEGPWVTQIYRHPDARGVGGPMLRRALGIATRDGLTAIGLAVTHANPARALYARLGFAHVAEALNVDVP